MPQGSYNGHNWERGKRATSEQQAIVRNSYAKLVPIAPQVADLFYSRLFEIDPGTEPLFHGDMAEQGRKLMATLTTVVDSIDRLDAVVPAVQHLGRQHKDYGAQPKHYETAGSALLWTLQRALGKDFTPAAQAAWTEAWTILAGTMTHPAA
jgi:nitric oxide dioxygenase